MSKRIRLAALVSLAFLALFPGRVASAQVKPGDFIDFQNASKVHDLVSPGVYWRVVHGMTMKIVATARIDWPPPYKDATEKYSGQVTLGRDHPNTSRVRCRPTFPTD